MCSNLSHTPTHPPKERKIRYGGGNSLSLSPSLSRVGAVCIRYLSNEGNAISASDERFDSLRCGYRIGKIAICRQKIEAKLLALHFYRSAEMPKNIGSGRLEKKIWNECIRKFAAYRRATHFLYQCFKRIKSNYLLLSSPLGFYVENFPTNSDSSGVSVFIESSNLDAKECAVSRCRSSTTQFGQGFYLILMYFSFGAHHHNHHHYRAVFSAWRWSSSVRCGMHGVRGMGCMFCKRTHARLHFTLSWA